MHAPWLYSEGISTSNTDRSRRAKAVMQQISERINVNLIEHQCFIDRKPEKMSPWGPFFAYHVCAVHMRSGQGDPDSSKRMRKIKETLLAVGVRWNAASTRQPFPVIFTNYLLIDIDIYLQLLEAREAINSS